MIDSRICVIGLGYVGLPLAVAFSKKYEVTGYDTSEKRIEELSSGFDNTGEIQEDDIHELKNIDFTSQLAEIQGCNIYIVTVPTPITASKTPDLEPLKNATTKIAGIVKRGDTVIYESTVFPGVTQNVCIPILEELSGLKLNRDFYCGYSPERINPGDKTRKLTDITKVTSGSNTEAARKVDQLYASIIGAGTHLASSIMVAEAAKVIENTQRDVNIALVNELSKIFHKVGIDTSEVLEAAGSKWNFIRFDPGLVGGHCIGVDPYYLASLAQSLNINPEVILSGRRINESMASHAASIFTKALVRKNVNLSSARVLICGYTFKEDCPDTRNTKIELLFTEMTEFGFQVDIYDPLAQGEIPNQKNLEDLESDYDGIILAVPHSCFFSPDKKFILSSRLKSRGVFFDLKSSLPKKDSDLRL